MLEQLEGLIPVLEQFFLNPLGLLMLLALVPLIIFYLARPQPEEKLMPSIMFFRKHESDSKLRSAFRRLMRNFILLLHVAVIVVFALAMAEPFAELPERPDDAVIVVDRSASMYTQDITGFVEDNLGESNTVVATGSQTEVVAEEIPPDQALSVVRDLEMHETETDVVSGIQTAENFPGELVIASDLDQTVDNRDAEEALRSTSKPVELMETEASNTFAVTELDVGRETTDISIMNYGADDEEVRARFNDETQTLSLDQGLNVHTVENDLGRNIFSLPEHGLVSDSTAYFYVPQHGGIGVHLAEEDRHFEKAVELIDELRIEEDAGQADVFYINAETDEGDLINEKVNQGAAAIVKHNSQALENVFSYETDDSAEIDDVVINYPQRISLGQSEYADRGLQGGESLSTPEEAVNIYNYGEGTVMAFNVVDSEFKRNILYPVFWKHTILRISETPSSQDLNVKTGGTVSSNGETATLLTTGFHEVGGRTYGANLLSESESSVSASRAEFTGSTVETLTEQNLQYLIVILLGFLLLSELFYLYRIGELR